MKGSIIGVLGAWLVLASLAAGEERVELPPAFLAEPATAKEMVGLLNPPPPQPDDVPPLSWYATADYLAWWLKPTGVSIPLVATTRGRVDLDPDNAGLKNKQVAILFGSQDIDFGTVHGFRAAFGYTPNVGDAAGFEVAGFFLPAGYTRFNFRSTGGDPALILPFLNNTRKPATEAGAIVAGLVDGKPVAGDIGIASAAELWDVELGPTLRVYDAEHYRFGVLAGFRYLRLREDLEVRARSDNKKESFETFDRFEATNSLYGGQVGGRLGWDWRSLYGDLTAKLAGGVVAETTRVGGYTIRPASAVKKLKGPTFVKGGFFSFNQQGEVKHTRFAVVPDLGFNVGWQLCDHVTLHAGYSGIYWSNIQEPGEQISRTFSRSKLPLFGGDPAKAPDPSRDRHETDFWAHGVNVGLDIEF